MPIGNGPNRPRHADHRADGDGHAVRLVDDPRTRRRPGFLGLMVRPRAIVEQPDARHDRQAVDAEGRDLPRRRHSGHGPKCDRLRAARTTSPIQASTTRAKSSPPSTTSIDPPTVVIVDAKGNIVDRFLGTLVRCQRRPDPTDEHDADHRLRRTVVPRLQTREAIPRGAARSVRLGRHRPGRGRTPARRGAAERRALDPDDRLRRDRRARRADQRGARAQARADARRQARSATTWRSSVAARRGLRPRSTRRARASTPS